MTAVWVSGVAVCGPGLDGWDRAREVLAGRAACDGITPALPPPALLAPNERRRTGPVTRLALAMAQQAAEMSAIPGAALRSIFASSSGDSATVSAILEAMASGDGAVSPTQFHNSVHNAPAGYWSIGIGSTQAASCLGCHDETVAAGLMQAAAEVCARSEPVLLSLYDVPMPEPLASCRPIDGVFGAALVLTPDATPTSLARLEIAYADAPPPEGREAPRAPAWRALSRGQPVARILRLLETLALAVPDLLSLAMLDGRLDVTVTPCR